MISKSSIKRMPSFLLMAAMLAVSVTALEANAQWRPDRASGGYERGDGSYDRDGRGRDRDRDRDGRGGPRRDIRNRYEAERLVQLLYRGALNRQADYEGLMMYSRVVVEQGQPGLIEVARAMGSSQEMADLLRREGSTRVIDNMYNAFFNRRADNEGLRYWKRLFDRGRGGEALAGIVASPEFQRRQL